MSRTRFRLTLPVTLLAVFAVLLTASACSNTPHEEDPQDYVRKITAGRAVKDADFQAGSDVIPDAALKATFLPLAYFAVDPNYNVLAGLKPITEDIQVMMPTSTGQRRKMRQVGRMEFTLKGEQMSLLAFNEVGAPDNTHVTLMFSDMTSGTETYAAGRYIDLPLTASGIYALDFNLAYHPYCYYNPAYECPYPPAENRLKVPIHAGERMKKSGDAQPQ